MLPPAVAPGADGIGVVTWKASLSFSLSDRSKYWVSQCTIITPMDSKMKKLERTIVRLPQKAANSGLTSCRHEQTIRWTCVYLCHKALLFKKGAFFVQRGRGEVFEKLRRHTFYARVRHDKQRTAFAAKLPYAFDRGVCDPLDAPVLEWNMKQDGKEGRI